MVATRWRGTNLFILGVVFLCLGLLDDRIPQQSEAASGLPDMTQETRKNLKEEARNMFKHAYDGYMENAFPSGDLMPVSCEGGEFGLVKVPLLTLIDSMDTLCVMGNYTEFRRAVGLVTERATFALDVNVSVFETSIRVLGGLLSSHMFATDPKLEFCDSKPSSRANLTYNFDDDYENCGEEGNWYCGGLLTLAVDLGDRLLPAFDTVTGIPYGTVNLLTGVPNEETQEANLAGAGTLTLEMSTLSALTGDGRYMAAADKAVRALHKYRSSTGLYGKHIDIMTGEWTEQVSGMGSNSDSFYEYLVKMYLLWGDLDYWSMFIEAYTCIERYMKRGDWYGDVDMKNGVLRKFRFESLMAFWPSVQILVGDLYGASRSLNAMYTVWRKWGLLPEQYNIARADLTSVTAEGAERAYHLRPELIESTLSHYKATNDSTWLWAGAAFMKSIETHCKTECGYASVLSVATKEHLDEMPSFVLSETTKYLYLLFDEGNFIHRGHYVFTTEAHPLPVRALRRRVGVLKSCVFQHNSGHNSTVKVGGGRFLKDWAEAALRKWGALPNDNMCTEKESTAPSGKVIQKAFADASAIDAKSIQWALDSSTSMTCIPQKWWLAPYHYQKKFKDDRGFVVFDKVHVSSSSAGARGKEENKTGATVTAQVEGLGTFVLTARLNGYTIGHSSGTRLEIHMLTNSLLLVVKETPIPTPPRGTHVPAVKEEHSKDAHKEPHDSPVQKVKSFFSKRFSTERKRGGNYRTKRVANSASDENKQLVVHDSVLQYQRAYEDDIHMHKKIEMGSEYRAVIVSYAGRAAYCSVKIEVRKKSGGGEKEEESAQKPLICMPALFGPPLSTWKPIPPNTPAPSPSITSQQYTGPLARATGEQICNTKKKSTALTTDRFNNTVVIALRGDCTFEEMATAAQRWNARGLIVVNSEAGGGVFAMDSKDGSGKSTQASSLAAVMVGMEDGTDLIERVTSSTAPVSVTIRLSTTYRETHVGRDVTNASLPEGKYPQWSDLMPPIFAWNGDTGGVEIQGGEGWSAILREVDNGGKWELSIMPKHGNKPQPTSKEKPKAKG